MAEGTTISSTKSVCPYYLYSTCQDGNSCPYSHNTSGPDYEVAKCRYFLKGMCKYGDNCWFTHSTPKNDVKTKRNDRQSAGPSGRSAGNTPAPLTPKHDVNKRNTHVPTFSLLNKNAAKKEKKPEFGPGSPNWVNAPEFIPKTIRTYADTVKFNTCVEEAEPDRFEPYLELCPYFFDGECPNNELCPYIHGELCELCNKCCLNPYDEMQRRNHIELCEKELEQDMELSFAIQRSMDKTCGICMDVVMEKVPLSERRFGILEKCSHVFCLSCIRKWRRVKSFESNPHVDHLVDPGVTRACPECRISSDFITPSQYWVDTEEEKTKLISDYKIALSKKPCKYYKQGKGTCPFGGACFYLHAKPDGTKVSLPLPTRRRRRNQDGELDYMDRIVLWDYLEGRDVLMQLDLDDIVYAESDDSDHDTDDSSEEEEEDNFIFSDPI